MRLTETLAKIPSCFPRQESKVKYKPNGMEMKLRNKVSGKGDGVRRAFCLQEMFNMFSCMKKHEFSQNKCSGEIATFQNCAEKHRTEMAQRKQDNLAGVLTPGATTLSAPQVNKLLKKFAE